MTDAPSAPPAILLPSPATLAEIDSAIIRAIRDDFEELRAAELMIARMDLLVAPLLARIVTLEEAAKPPKTMDQAEYDAALKQLREEDRTTPMP